eukprot:snap_masked-scaffold_7-processed-gene-13.39-mRNA-1 protein AED:1.00 eAED:1.00 QI:0/-1/0/0/-1/1/1/0/1163
MERKEQQPQDALFRFYKPSSLDKRSIVVKSLRTLIQNNTTRKEDLVKRPPSVIEYLSASFFSLEHAASGQSKDPGILEQLMFIILNLLTQASSHSASRSFVSSQGAEVLKILISLPTQEEKTSYEKNKILIVGKVLKTLFSTTSISDDSAHIQEVKNAFALLIGSIAADKPKVRKAAQESLVSVLIEFKGKHYKTEKGLLAELEYVLLSLLNANLDTYQPSKIIQALNFVSKYFMAIEDIENAKLNSLNVCKVIFSIDKLIVSLTVEQKKAAVDNKNMLLIAAALNALEKAAHSVFSKDKISAEEVKTCQKLFSNILEILDRKSLYVILEQQSSQASGFEKLLKILGYSFFVVYQENADVSPLSELLSKLSSFLISHYSEQDFYSISVEKIFNFLSFLVISEKLLEEQLHSSILMILTSKFSLDPEHEFFGNLLYLYSAFFERLSNLDEVQFSPQTQNFLETTLMNMVKNRKNVKENISSVDTLIRHLVSILTPQTTLELLPVVDKIHKRINLDNQIILSLISKTNSSQLSFFLQKVHPDIIHLNSWLQTQNFKKESSLKKAYYTVIEQLWALLPILTDGEFDQINEESYTQLLELLLRELNIFLQQKSSVNEGHLFTVCSTIKIIFKVDYTKKSSGLIEELLLKLVKLHLLLKSQQKVGLTLSALEVTLKSELEETQVKNMFLKVMKPLIMTLQDTVNQKGDAVKYIQILALLYPSIGTKDSAVVHNFIDKCLSNSGATQSLGYRLFSRLLRDDSFPLELKRKYLEVVLKHEATTLDSSSKVHRMRIFALCIQKDFTLFRSVNRFDEVILEIVMCLKDQNSKVKTISSNLVLSLSSAVPLEELLQTILIGLVTENNFTISSSINALSLILVNKFHLGIEAKEDYSEEFINSLADTIKAVFASASKSRETAKSIIDFCKNLLKTRIPKLLLSEDLFDEFLELMLKTLNSFADDSKNKFKLKVRLVVSLLYQKASRWGDRKQTIIVQAKIDETMLQYKSLAKVAKYLEKKGLIKSKMKSLLKQQNSLTDTDLKSGMQNILKGEEMESDDSESSFGSDDDSDADSCIVFNDDGKIVVSEKKKRSREVVNTKSQKENIRMKANSSTTQCKAKKPAKPKEKLKKKRKLEPYQYIQLNKKVMLNKRTKTEASKQFKSFGKKKKKGKRS